jgi:hypothetical protein
VYYELPHGQIAEISRLAGLWWAVLYDRPGTFELAFSL